MHLIPPPKFDKLVFIKIKNSNYQINKRNKQVTDYEKNLQYTFDKVHLSKIFLKCLQNQFKMQTIQPFSKSSLEDMFTDF